MLVYEIILFLFSINSFLNYKNTKYINFIIYLFFIVIYSLRKEVGTDWVGYKDYFENYSSGAVEEYLFEIGYQTLNCTISYLSDSYWTLVFIVSIFVGILFWKATNKYTKNIGIIMLLSLYYIFYPSLEAFRQSITLILFYYSLIYIQKDKKKYLVINLIGSLFHRTGYFTLLFFIFNSNKSVRISILLLLIFYSQFEPILLNFLDDFYGFGIKYTFYFDVMRADNNIFSIKLLEYILMVFYYLILNKTKGLEDREKVIFHLILLGCCFQIAFSQISDIVYRILYYTDIGFMLTFVFIYDKINDFLYKNLYIMLLIAYICLRFYKIFPFNNYDFHYIF